MSGIITPFPSRRIGYRRRASKGQARVVLLIEWGEVVHPLRCGPLTIGIGEVVLSIRRTFRSLHDARIMLLRESVPVLFISNLFYPGHCRDDEKLVLRH